MHKKGRLTHMFTSSFSSQFFYSWSSGIFSCTALCSDCSNLGWAWPLLLGLLVKKPSGWVLEQ